MRMKMLNRFTQFKFILIICLFSSPSLAAGNMEVHDAWVREAPPEVKVLAAYLTLHNHSEQTKTLNHLSSPDFEQVEIHRTEMKNGMVSMKPVSRMILNPGASMVFEPGGLHLMLFEPHNSLASGDKIKILLEFTDHTSLEFSAEVRKQAPGAEPDNHTHQ